MPLQQDTITLKELDRAKAVAIENQETWGVSREGFDLWITHRGNADRMRVHFNAHRNVNADCKSFSHAHLTAVGWDDSSFTVCDFTHARLCYSNFTNVKFRRSNFSHADLEQSEFINCDLSDCWFGSAAIPRVSGLKIVAPVGFYGRLIYAYVYNGEIRIQAGCRNNTPDVIRDAIMRDYDKCRERSDYLDTVKLLERWGKREIKRVKALTK